MEDIAVDLIAEYADVFYRRQRRRWEHSEIEVVTLTEADPNNAATYELSVDATEAQLVKEARCLADAIGEGRWPEYWYRELKIGAIQANAHAYRPLLYAEKERVIAVQPVPLDESERRVVEGLEALARNRDPCLHGKELFLIRNLTQGRGVSFFDDFGYYPDFIVWLKDDVLQHVLFLDPKGLSRFGERERRKVLLHREIAQVEKRVRDEDPNLRLRAFVLSVTPPTKIGDSGRSAHDWKADGVYFLNESDCLKQVIEHALGE